MIVKVQFTWLQRNSRKKAERNEMNANRKTAAHVEGRVKNENS